MKRGIVFLLACAAVQLCGQSDLPPEVLLLSRIKHRAAADLAHLPNVTCLENIERASRHSQSKPFHVQDVVELEVARVGDDELFSWPGAAHFENRPIAEIVGTGLTSNGEFESNARAVFAGDSAVIRYSGVEDVGGHHAARFDFLISPVFSHWTVNLNGAKGLVGMRGSFWADTTSFELLRLSVEASEIPIGLEIRSVRSDIEYGRIQIGSNEFLLPRNANTWMVNESGAEVRNRIDFTHCRQYTTESVLSANAAPPEAADNPTPTTPTIEFTLPPDLLCDLRLETSVRTSEAKVGDAISATVTSDIKQNGKLLVPKGATASGRLRVLQKVEGTYIAGLEFTDLTFENQHAFFYAMLVSADPRYASRQVKSEKLHESTPTSVTSIVEVEVPPNLPGVGTFFLPAEDPMLPKGTAMEWKTVRLGK